MPPGAKSHPHGSQWGFCVLHGKSSPDSRETAENTQMRQQVIILVFFPVTCGPGTPLPAFSLHPPSPAAAAGGTLHLRTDPWDEASLREAAAQPRACLQSRSQCNTTSNTRQVSPSEAVFSCLVTRRKITGEDGEEGPQGRRAWHQALCGLSLGGPADTHREFVPPSAPL